MCVGQLSFSEEPMRAAGINQCQLSLVAQPNSAQRVHVV